MNALRKKKLGLSGLQLLLISFFLISVLLPLIRMLINMTSANFSAIVTSNRFAGALKNSLAISVTATLISVALALALSWCVIRTRIRFKGFWCLLFTLPMLIP